jgi:3-dehydroquinate synthetase
MLIESHLSHLCGLLSREELADIHQHLDRFRILLEPSIPFEDLWMWMQHDKKKEGDKLQFTLLESAGAGKINCECTVEQCRRAYTEVFG